MSGVAHIHATYNNVIVNISDQSGNTLCWKSSGTMGFKGPKKSTPYAAQTVADALARESQSNFGMKSISIRVSGPGSGRDSAVRALSAVLSVSSITDITPIPHNGCRPCGRRKT